MARSEKEKQTEEKQTEREETTTTTGSERAQRAFAQASRSIGLVLISSIQGVTCDEMIRKEGTSVTEDEEEEEETRLISKP